MGRPSKPRALDLFGGCGGLTQGLRDAGFKIVGAVDNDPLAAESYRANHKGVRFWITDIRRLPARALMNELGLRAGELDLLAGCPPCQGFSPMRTLNGSRRVRDKATKDLVLHFVRFVRVLMPRYVMLENVPRLSKDRRMQYVLKTLRRLGYDRDYRIHNAADYGVPQRRKRLILIASRVGPVTFPPPKKSRHTVKDVLVGLPKPGRSGDPLHDFPEKRDPRILEIIRRVPKNGGSRLDAGAKFGLKCHRGFDGFKDVYGRMRWDDVAPTITGGCVNPSKGRFLHPSQDRSITLREAALLQSFPKRYHISLRRGKFPAAMLIGNAFPPKFAKAHAVPIARCLGMNPTYPRSQIPRKARMAPSQRGRHSGPPPAR